MKVYSNGDLVQREDLKEIFEPGYLFGWGVFEPIRVYGDNISFLDEHIKRLNDGLGLLGLEKASVDFEEEIWKVINANDVEDAYLRLTAYKKRQSTGLLIYADSFGYYTDEVYEKGFTCVVSPHRRNPEDLSSKVKSLSYLQNRVSWLEAQKRKKSEALMLNLNNKVCGGSRSNLFIINDNQLITPPLKSGAFSGITREKVLELAKDLNIEIVERAIENSEINLSSEAFITSALMEVMPLVEFEDKPIGNGKPGSLTNQLLSEYRTLTRK